ncbi:MAG: polyvinylalcohol dehydrogenase [Planctomycetota bacterium]|nr:MAG: polyvinylalcohol dehydrogenase [Planctomycetota bacterium]
MKRVASWLAAVGVLAGASTSVSALDWAGWRGPQRDGICREEGLLSQWPEGGPRLVWKASGLGRGYSSVAVVGERIYTMGQRGKNPRRVFVIALRRSDGRELWAREIPGTHHPNSTPTVDGDRVYAIGATGELVCLQASDGRLLWSKNFGKDFGGKMMSGWGYSESPLIDGDKLICTPGGTDALVVALDKRTGATIWKGRAPGEAGSRGRDGAGYASVVISHGAGVRQYIQLVGRGLVSYAADDGRLLWHYNRIANGTANIPTPIVDGDLVFCSTGYGTGAALLRLRPDGNDGVRADEVYFLNAKTLQNHHGGMVKVGPYIYCGHGHNKGFPICVEMATGRIVWGPERGPGSGSAAVLYADGHLYFRYENGVMALIRATPEGYRLDGRFQLATLNGKSWPHPVIADRKLYVRDQNDLLCYDLAAR